MQGFITQQHVLPNKVSVLRIWHIYSQKCRISKTQTAVLRWAPPAGSRMVLRIHLSWLHVNKGTSCRKRHHFEYFILKGPHERENWFNLARVIFKSIILVQNTKKKTETRGTFALNVYNDWRVSLIHHVFNNDIYL